MCFNYSSSALSYNKSDEEISQIIEKIYNTRSSVFISGDFSLLKPLYDLSQRKGQWSLEHEVRRVKYLRDWSKKHDVMFKDIKSNVNITKVLKKSDTGMRVILVESYKFDYVYNKDTLSTINSFGVGLRHVAELTNKNGDWQLMSDWYTDCFEDAMGSYSGELTSGSQLMELYPDEVFNETKNVNNKKSFNRQKAVEYADKYCGAAWGNGNNYKYNKKYMDYNGAGGDCTNFISQAIGDSEGGGLRQDSAWHPGSRAWTNANGLKDYLTNYRKGYVVAKGTYSELTEPRPNYPNGMISKLQIGDLICYVKNGDPDHHAIVTAKDSNGYFLVNSHTTDRYHVPWDLGWGDKRIKFVMIHITG